MYSMKISPPQTIPWHHQALARIKSHYFLKAFGISFFMWAFFTGYFYLLNNPISPVTIMPLTALDVAIGFQPGALLLYASLWLYVSLPPALQATRRELIYYGLAVAILCLAGLTCFLIWPTAVPAAHIDWEYYYGFPILKGVDAAGNACPSLHVATAVFSGVWLHRQLSEMGTPRFVIIGNWLWCVAIVYSTLATKQHVALDMAAGVVLGILAAMLALALIPRPIPQRSIPLESMRSQEL